jgi:hypothetical protein
MARKIITAADVADLITVTRDAQLDTLLDVFRAFTDLMEGVQAHDPEMSGFADADCDRIAAIAEAVEAGRRTGMTYRGMSR